MKKILLSVLFVILFCVSAIAGGAPVELSEVKYGDGEATIKLTEVKYIDDGTPINDFDIVSADRAISMTFICENAVETTISGDFTQSFPGYESSSQVGFEGGITRTYGFSLEAGHSVTVRITATDSEGKVTTESAAFEAEGVRAPEITPTPDSTSTSSSGGGCNAAGLSAFAIAALAFVARRGISR
jgi:hypothetical protein